MADGGRVGEFPQEIIGDQRLPLRVVLDERLDMSLQQIGGDCHRSLPSSTVKTQATQPDGILLYVSHKPVYHDGIAGPGRKTVRSGEHYRPQPSQQRDRQSSGAGKAERHASGRGRQRLPRSTRAMRASASDTGPTGLPSMSWRWAPRRALASWY